MEWIVAIDWLLFPIVMGQQERTVKQVVETILTFQAILMHFENDAIDKQTGRVRQGSVTLTRTHRGDHQTAAQEHVISVCAERIAKVVKSFQPTRQEPEPEPEPESIYSVPRGFTVALDVPDYDIPEGMVAQIKEADQGQSHQKAPAIQGQLRCSSVVYTLHVGECVLTNRAYRRE